MVRWCMLCIFIFSLQALRAQEDDKYVYRHVLKGSATLCPGFMLAETQTNIYVNGHLEYFPEDRVSLRGEAFWFTGAQQKPALLKEASGFMFGALYHFHKNRLDYFFGLETGATLAKPNDTQDSIIVFVGPQTLPGPYYSTTTHKNKALPVFSPVTGITFYVGKYFNFFLEARYVSGRYFGYRYGTTLRMDEIRISAGLGFQLPLKKN